jgi:transcription elongation factor GreB
MADEDDDKDEAPKPRGPTYMTPGGTRRIEEELERLGDERVKVTKTTADAAAEGDRSENAEYIYGKRRMRQIDSRMRFLRKILESVVVIDPALDRGDRIFFGATVTLSEEGAENVTYAIVGEHETDAERGRISYRSPLGAALLKKSIDDEVVINTPRGKRALTIVDVVYQPVD